MMQKVIIALRVICHNDLPKVSWSLLNLLIHRYKMINNPATNRYTKGIGLHPNV